MTVTLSRLKKLLSYSPTTGQFVWLVNRAGRYHAGQVAGSVHSDGRRYIGIDRRLYLAHRLAWLYVNGRWPSTIIDHRDGNQDNNTIDNLRPATKNQNNSNSKQRRSLPKGVHECTDHYRRKRYRAQITVNGAFIYLGRFADSEEAHGAYCVAAKKYFGEFARYR